MLALAATAVVAALSTFVGGQLVAPAQRDVAAPSGLPVETLTIGTGSDERLRAWMLTPAHPRGAVAVLHGVRANRGDMAGRARILFDAGYAVLVPDFRAHGESTGHRVTFGHDEARDTEVAVAFLRNRHPNLPLGAVGVSMGGAALLMAAPRLRLDAAVLEAVFPTLRGAVDNRVSMRLGRLSPLVTPLLLAQLRPRLGFDVDALRPIDSIPRIGCPVLVMGGALDRHTTETETRALFGAAREPRELWVVPGAGHVDLLRRDPDGYRSRVLSFLERHLGHDSASESRSSPEGRHVSSDPVPALR